MAIAPRDRGGFQVAIFCALPLEAENVQSVFDICWEDQGKHYGRAAGDQNTYTTGLIGKHNVVLVHMPSMGNNSAAVAAAGLRSSFLKIQLALVVGICGVAPVDNATKKDIVLGDIIISTAMIAYDFGRQYPHGFQRKGGVEDSLGRANPEIRSFISMLQTSQNRQRFNRDLRLFITSEDFQTKVPAAVYPGLVHDRLYESSYTHEHRTSVTCDRCLVDLGTCSSSCDELGCEGSRLVTRGSTGPQKKSKEGDTVHTPYVHLGRFGSANTVMKSSLDRDRIATADEVIAFEMEGAGVWEQYPTIVIKSACDYADSHKHKGWQGYSAAMAAACLKVFLNWWVLPDQPVERDESSGPIWHVPFDSMPDFIGRSEELTQLKQSCFAMDPPRIVSVVGLGGIGKSRLALELANYVKLEHPQDSVYWVQAAGQLTFEKDMLEIGKRLSIPGIEGDKADVKALVKQRLSDQRGSKWFLILDNADDEALWGRRRDQSHGELSLVDFLPRTTNGSMLITTRSRRVANFLAEKEVIELRSPSPDKAAEMVMKKLKSRHLAADRALLSRLTKQLEYLPLAIVQAASFINMTERPLQTYIDLLNEPEADVIKLLSEDFQDRSRYPDAVNPVASTWLISFAHIRKYHPLAADFLSSMACLHEKGIPISLLPKASSKIELIETIATLTGFSFVTKQTETNSSGDDEELYDMHRLVRLVARNCLKMEHSFTDRQEACISQMVQIWPPDDHTYRKIWTRYLPHAQRLCDEGGANDSLERYMLLSKMGDCLHADGKYKDAVKMFTVMKDWKEQEVGATDPDRLQIYIKLGYALSWNCDWSTAETYFRQALISAEEVLGHEHPGTLSCMSGLASSLGGQGHWKEAEEWEKKVLAIMERVSGREDPFTVTSMGNLATAYQKLGRLTEAEDLLLRVVETEKRKVGVDHPRTMIGMNNLALIYSSMKRFEEAILLQLQVLEAQKTGLGPEHPSTLVSMGNLALWYTSQGRLTQAEDMGLQVLEASKRTLGQEHSSTLKAMSNLAWAHFEQDRLAVAEELEIQVLETSRRALGTEHPDTLTYMSNLAMVSNKLGYHEKAIGLMRTCVELNLKVLGPAHPNTHTDQ